LAVLVVFVAAVVGAGSLVQRAIETAPSGALAACHPTRLLAPRTYLGVPAMCIDRNRTYLADIQTIHGKITISMSAKTDPETVNNFVVLAGNGFYNGLSFWHVQSW